MELPDYTKYTLEELYDVYENIDKEKYPERFKIVEREIKKKANQQEYTETKESPFGKAIELYTNTSISIATFFGGPIAAGYLMSQNYKRIGNEEGSRKAFYLGLISTVVLFGLIFIVPETIMEKIPQALFPSVYTGIIYMLVEKYQGEHIKAHLSGGGEKASGWKAAGIGILGMVIIFVFLFSLSLLAPSIEDEKMTLTYTDEEKKGIRLSVILVKTQDESIEILNKLNQGEEFAELAKQFSMGPGRERGGDIGFIMPGDMIKGLNKIAEQLKVGEYSNSIETESGFFIILKTDEKGLGN